ncbi:chemotaxis protein CheW [Desulfobacterales bacterium HSG16]|nr:chemotaxis protein CheW [Desulfobacterales bacterium HSG16]
MKNESEKQLSEKVEITDGCWKKIGVWGNEKVRCPKLDTVIHCRNCIIFTQVGRNLLDRELSQEYRDEWTKVMATKKEEELFNTISVVIFRIEQEWLSIRTKVFAEVINPENLHSHSLPHRHNPVLIGIINIRGEIQLCVSLKDLLGIEGYSTKKNSSKSYKRMMVMDKNDEKWVFPIDEIHGIHRVHPNTFQNVPVTVAKAQATFTKGIFKWNDKHVAFMDDDLLLFSLTKSVQ